MSRVPTEPDNRPQASEAAANKPAASSLSSGLVLVKNAMSAMAGTIATALIGFFLTPFLIHQLGEERFGIWTLIFSIVTMTELADFGIGMSVQRFTAEYLAHQAVEKISNLTNQAFTLVAMFLVILSVPLFITDLLLPVAFKITPQLLTEAQWAMGILILSMIVMIPLSVLTGVIAGYQRYELTNLNWVGFSLLRAPALIICVFMPSPLVAMAAATALLAVLRLFSLIHLVKKLCPVYRFRLQWPNPEFIRQVVRYGGSLFSISVLGRLIYTSDAMLIGVMMNAAAITYYTIGAKWSDMLRMVLGGAIQVCFPAFSHLNSTKDEARIRDILINGSRAAMGLGILGAAMLILLAAPIIHFWLGPGYEQSIPIMRWMGMIGVFTSLAFPFEHYLKAIGKTRPLFLAVLFNFCINLPASIFLIRHVGIIGAVWGTLAPLVATTLFLVIPLACKNAGISLRDFFRQLAAPLFLPVCWVFFLATAFHFYPPPLHTFSLMAAWAAIIVCGYLCLWCMTDPIPRRLINRIKLASHQS